MKFIHDHDLHIHSRISPCGGDPAQTPERILQYALDNQLNIVNALDFTREKDADELKVYRIAKEMGCKFYFGSDAHTVEGLMRRVRERCEKIVDLLDLTEDDKFTI